MTDAMTPEEKLTQVREALELAANHAARFPATWTRKDADRVRDALRILQREGEAEAVTTHEHLTVTVRAPDIMEAHRTAQQVAAFLRQRNPAPTPTATEREEG